LPREGAAAELAGILIRIENEDLVLRLKTAKELPPGAAIEKTSVPAEE
jgi:hypothetical protein